MTSQMLCFCTREPGIGGEPLAGELQLHQLSTRITPHAEQIGEHRHRGGIIQRWQRQRHAAADALPSRV